MSFRLKLLSCDVRNPGVSLRDTQKVADSKIKFVGVNVAYYECDTSL